MGVLASIEVSDRQASTQSRSYELPILVIQSYQSTHAESYTPILLFVSAQQMWQYWLVFDTQDAIHVGYVD